jgi:hypothetical protein
MRHLDYSNVGVPLSKVSFSCKIRNKDNSTSQICADSSKVMSDLCGPRCVCDMIRAASHQVDHNAGLGFRRGNGTDLCWVVSIQGGGIATTVEREKESRHGHSSCVKCYIQVYIVPKKCYNRRKKRIKLCILVGASIFLGSAQCRCKGRGLIRRSK